MIARLWLGPNCAQEGLVGHGGINARRACDHGVRGSLRLEVHHLDIFHGKAVFAQHPGEREIGCSARRAGGNGLALQFLDAVDAGLHHHAVSPVALVELEDLRGGHAIGVPDDPGFHCGRGTLDVARSDGEVTVFLRDFFQCDVQSVLLEEARLFCERERRKARPARQSNSDLDFLCSGRAGESAEQRCCGHRQAARCDCLHEDLPES